MAMLASFSMPLAAAGPWLALNPPGAEAAPVVELDVSSIHQGLLGPEAVIRVSRRTMHEHDAVEVAYRSWRMNLVFHCGPGELEPIAVSFFAGPRGEGTELAWSSNLSTPGIPDSLLDVLSPPVRSSLLRAACRRGSVMHR